MKPFLSMCALCFVLAVAVSGCGGDDATSSQTQDSTSASSAGGGDAGSAPPLESKPVKVVIGSHEAEGPFAAITGRKGNKKPLFEPSGRPASKQTFIRDLKVGSGPAAERGDEVSIYYAGAHHDTGKIQYYGWPPKPPATFELGYAAFGRSWEKTIEGMRAGGIRHVIITADYLSRGPLDYVIVLNDLRPQAGKE